MRMISSGRLLVCSLIAFLLLGGGTALASFVVSSNSQIGPGTVSGHNPPTGKHSNLIPGSIDATDLGPAAVTAPKLAPSVRLPQGCAQGQVAKANGSNAWSCGKPGVYTDASDNVAAGPTTFPALTTGEANSAVGAQNALNKDTTGTLNSAFGDGALGANTMGAKNSALGGFALGVNESGNSNTAVGQSALFENTGSFNTALGDSAGVNLTTGQHNLDLANGGVAGDSLTIRIGAGQTRTFLAGVSGVTTGGAASPVVVDSNGQLGTTSSARRVKTDVQPLRAESRRLMRLRPVSFRYKSQVRAHGSAPRQYGLIAEQVRRIYPNLVVRGQDGRPNAVAYQELPALLLAQNQAQQRRLHRATSRIATLERQVRRLDRKVR